MTSLRATLMRAALALGLSFTMWVFVSFSQNPEELVTFFDMQLEVVGLGPNLVLVDSNGMPNPSLPTIDVTLRTDRQQLATLRQVDVLPVVDLSNLGPGEHIVPVNVKPTRSNVAINVPPGGVEPSVVTTRIEQISQRLLPIRVDVQGNLPFSFERGEPRISTGGRPITSTTVVGPQSRVDRVAEVVAVARVDQLRATYVAPLSLSALDVAGQVVEGVRLDPGTVTVEVPINPVVGLKLVPVAPSIEGLPASGYEVRSVTVEPPLITIAGSSGPLDEVDLLPTTSLSINGATSDVVSTVAVRFPEGTSPREGEPSAVRVSIRIAPLERPFQVQLPATVQIVGLDPSLSASLSPPSLSLTLSGSSGALADLATGPLRGVIDLAGLGPGGYVLTPTLDLPDGVSLVGDLPTVQVTLRVLAQPVPTAAPRPTTTETSVEVPTATTETSVEVPTATAETSVEVPTAIPEVPTATPGG